MFQVYSNPQIYKNIKIAKILTIISCILSIVSVLTYVLYYEILDFPFGAEEISDAESSIAAKIMFYGSPVYSFGCMGEVNSYSRFTPGKQSKGKNDCTAPNHFLICALLPLVWAAPLWLLDAILYLCGRQSSYVDLYDLSAHIGAMLVAHIFLYVAAGFLRHVCKLVKQEWELNSPVFYAQARIEQEEKEAAQKAEQDTKKYHVLIEQCGVRFFIKYYRQILRLPLRDVAVTENFSSKEREERLIAVKKIIDRGLSELALTDILEKYGDILDASEVEQAQALLAEIHQTAS